MKGETVISETRVFQPGWNHALKLWWWWAWRTVLCSILGGAAWSFLAINVFPPNSQETAVITGGYLWGLASSVYFLKSLFTHCRFYDFCPALIKS